MTRLTFVTRDGCHLCETARADVDAVLARPDLSVSLEVLDVDADPVLRSEYGDQVPVVLLDGELHSFFEVDPVRLLADLRDRARASRRAADR
jgi:hypothetical protein